MFFATLLVVFVTLYSASGLQMPTQVAKARAGSMGTAVLDYPLPTVYVYDHCPFCVRVRLAFGLKGLKHEVRFLANDDIPTPTKLIGKKIAPIFTDEINGVKMGESLDIIELVDNDPKYGTTGMFKSATGRTDIKDWQKKVKATNSMMQRPRYMMSYLPEFATQAGKDAFVKNHPIGDMAKPDWKDDSKISYDERWGKYVESYKDSLTKIDEVSASLKELDAMVYSTEHCSEGGLSYDDIDLWARLRSLTIIKGVVWPEKLWGYMTTLAEKGDVPLLDTMQC